MRTAPKTASYALTHLAVGIAVVYAVTQDWLAAVAIGALQSIFQRMAFALHERAWATTEPRRQAAAAGFGAGVTNSDLKRSARWL